MDAQDIWTGALLVPSAVLGVVAWRARAHGRTTLGLEVRNGAVGEFLAGCLFSVPFFVGLLILFDATDLTGDVGWSGGWGPAVGIAVYFLVLFLLEEVVFRGLLLTGLGVVTGQLVALLVTSVLVGGAYALAPDSGVLPVLGAVVTNALTGCARWRTGRIWWGLGQRWLWNSALVAFGFSDSAYRLEHGLMHQPLAAPDWVTGGDFGVEGGAIGIVLQAVMLLAVLRFAEGRTGPWRVRDARPARLP